jgi:hypothetical protein
MAGSKLTGGIAPFVQTIANALVLFRFGVLGVGIKIECLPV